MRVAVTGANGFVGRALIGSLLAHGHSVKALTRGPDTSLILPGVEGVATGAIEQITDWRPFLDRVEAVVHLAARAHVKDADFADEVLVQAINTRATLSLAESAARRGVRRFVYLSSVKVNGEATEPGRPFRPDDPPAPGDLYARSKADAERGLAEIAARTGLAVTVLRPPLVYGTGVRANMRALIDLVARVPALPFGAIDNRRSLISVDNLASALVVALSSQAAAGRTYLVSDGEDPSTPDLVRAIARHLGRTVLLLPVPVPVLEMAGRAFGRQAQIERLTRSLQVDPSAFVAEAGWRPVETLDQGLAKAIRSFRAASARAGVP